MTYRAILPTSRRCCA